MVCINVKCMPLLSDLYRGYAIKSVFCVYVHTQGKSIYCGSDAHELNDVVPSDNGGDD